MLTKCAVFVHVKAEGGTMHVNIRGLLPKNRDGRPVKQQREPSRALTSALTARGKSSQAVG